MRAELVGVVAPGIRHHVLLCPDVTWVVPAYDTCCQGGRRHTEVCRGWKEKRMADITVMAMTVTPIDNIKHVLE